MQAQTSQDLEPLFTQELSHSEASVTYFMLPVHDHYNYMKFNVLLFCVLCETLYFYLAHPLFSNMNDLRPFDFQTEILETSPVSMSIVRHY